MGGGASGGGSIDFLVFVNGKSAINAKTLSFTHKSLLLAQKDSVLLKCISQTPLSVGHSDFGKSLF